MSHWDAERIEEEILWSKCWPDEEAFRRKVVDLRESHLLARLRKRLDGCSLPTADRHRIVAGNFEKTDSVRAVAKLLGRAETSDGPSRGLILSGGVGTGKTFGACTALVHHRADDFWFSTGTYVEPDDLHAIRHPRRDDPGPKRELKGYITVLDDVGTETDPKFPHAFLELINECISFTPRVLILTTNLTKEQFRERYDARIIDRLNSFETWVQLRGASRRVDRCGL